MFPKTINSMTGNNFDERYRASVVGQKALTNACIYYFARAQSPIGNRQLIAVTTTDSCLLFLMSFKCKYLRRQRGGGLFNGSTFGSSEDFSCILAMMLSKQIPCHVQVFLRSWKCRLIIWSLQASFLDMHRITMRRSKIIFLKWSLVCSSIPEHDWEAMYLTESVLNMTVQENAWVIVSTLY
jgi:hypothetical protein